MSYTNETIEEKYLPDSRKAKEEYMLRAELNFYKDCTEQYRGKMTNIPAAIKAWGYIDISCDNGETITLVPKYAETDKSETV